MSAQGATLGGRGNVLHLPIWPVAALVAAVAAVTIGVTMIGEQGRDATRPFTLTGEAANSTTAIRESGVVIPAVVGISHVAPSVPAVSEGYAGFENPAAYAPQLPTFATGLENPAAYAPQAPTYAPGLENPGAYPSEALPATNPCPASCQQARR
jgi:hypothetical protein